VRLFILRNPTARVKGLLRTNGREVSTNVFVLTCNRVEAEGLYTKACQLGENVLDFNCTLVQDSNSDPSGFTVRSFQEVSVGDLDGIPTRQRRSLKSFD
jgi:hypothetical protein